LGNAKLGGTDIVNQRLDTTTRIRIAIATIVVDSLCQTSAATQASVDLWLYWTGTGHIFHVCDCRLSERSPGGNFTALSPVGFQPRSQLVLHSLQGCDGAHHPQGKLSGWSASVAGLLTLLVGLLLWRNNENGRDVYVLILLVASFLWIVAAAVYQLIFEPAEESSDDSANTTSTALLWRDRNFRNFILVRTLLLSSALITPFYTILIQESSSQRSQLGLLVMASSLAAIASGPIWGKLADWSSRWVLIIAGIIVAINGLLSVTINHNLETSFNLWLTLAFFFQIFAYQGVRLGRKIYLVDMAEGDQRTDYVALGNSLIGVMLLVCSLFGVVAQFFSVAAVITLLSMMSLVAALLALRLPEVEVEVEVLTDE
jgi:hypothetical protein